MAVLFADGECHEDAYLEDPRDRWDDDEVTAVESYAADGCEGETMTEDSHEGFEAPLREFTPSALVSMRNAIDHELKSRREALKRELDATEHALNGTKPRATRSDKGTTRDRKEVAA